MVSSRLPVLSRSSRRQMLSRKHPLPLPRPRSPVVSRARPAWPAVDDASPKTTSLTSLLPQCARPANSLCSRAVCWPLSHSPRNTKRARSARRIGRASSCSVSSTLTSWTRRPRRLRISRFSSFLPSFLLREARIILQLTVPLQSTIFLYRYFLLPLSFYSCSVHRRLSLTAHYCW